MADWKLGRGLIRLIGSMHAVALRTLVKLTPEGCKGLKRKSERDNYAANGKKLKSYFHVSWSIHERTANANFLSGGSELHGCERTSRARLYTCTKRCRKSFLQRPLGMTRYSWQTGGRNPSSTLRARNSSPGLFRPASRTLSGAASLGDACQPLLDGR